MVVVPEKYHTYQNHAAVLILAVLLLGRVAYGQASSLSLASGTTVQGSSLSLNLSLSAATSAPATLQWTLTYSPTAVASLSAVAGPALTAVGDTLSCNNGAGTLVCVASGMNASAIGSGVVAVVAASLSPTSSATLDSLPMSNVMGSLPDGTYANMTGTGGTISVFPGVSTLQCTPATLTSGSASTCTVTLSMAAQSGGVVVALSDNNAALTVPASVTVAAGATTATFQATATTISSSQSATVTATYSGTSAGTGISLTPVLVSSLDRKSVVLGKSVD